MSIPHCPFAWCLSWVLCQRVAAKRQTTETRAPCSYVEVITVSVTNDNINVPCVVPEHLNSPVQFRLVMSATISHVQLMCDSGHVLFVSFLSIFVYWCPTRFMWCSICSPFRSTPVFSGVHVAISLVFCIMFYGLLFALL